MTELPKAPVARLIKSTGTIRVSEDAIETLQTEIESYAKAISKKAKTFADHAGRKTVQASDIELAINE